MRRSLSHLSRPVRSVAVVAASAVIIGAGLTGTASAQDVEGSRSKVQRLAAEMDRLEAKSSQLDEQYLQTQIDLQGAQNDLKKNQHAVADAKARMDAAKSQANSYLVSAYMSAGSDVAGLGVGDPNRAVNERVLTETLHGDREQVADHLRAAQADLNDRTAQLDSASKSLAAKKDQQSSVKADLESSVAQQQNLLDGANDELRQAIAAPAPLPTGATGNAGAGAAGVADALGAAARGAAAALGAAAARGVAAGAAAAAA